MSATARTLAPFFAAALIACGGHGGKKEPAPATQHLQDFAARSDSPPLETMPEEVANWRDVFIVRGETADDEEKVVAAMDRMPPAFMDALGARVRDAHQAFSDTLSGDIPREYEQKIVIRASGRSTFTTGDDYTPFPVSRGHDIWTQGTIDINTGGAEKCMDDTALLLRLAAFMNCETDDAKNAAQVSAWRTAPQKPAAAQSKNGIWSRYSSCLGRNVIR